MAEVIEVEPVSTLRTIPETAALLGGLHEQTVRKLIRTGELGCVRIGTRVFVSDDQRADYIDAHRYDPDGD